MMRTKALIGLVTAALVLLGLPEIPVANEMSEYETELINVSKKLKPIQPNSCGSMRRREIKLQGVTSAFA